ncbi:serine/threonine-protein kinase [Hydrogenobacter thermophilus]|uniref:serine/threonine protein kinase n=1 Tax=Hydrogenobacter thermophilus TaxID=940 RepID=UPI0030F9C762
MIGKKIGPYLIQEKLGEGGMGIVYKAIHEQIGQIVAVKTLHPQYAKDKDFRERFKREALVQAKLHHPNVVNILNYIEDEDGNINIVMEYVNGGSLEDKMSKGKLNLEDSVSIIVQVLNALSYMHSNGIIHRDIKPSNIMFSNGFVKVSDFGIAKPVEDKGLTRTGVLMGTVWYMAPEIIRGEPASFQSDIYAVGVILYQMLTGRSPFFGKTDFEIMKSHLEKEPPNPRDLNPQLPEGIEDIIKKALAKELDKRYKTAEDFKRAIIDWFSKVSNKPVFEEKPISGSLPLNTTFFKLKSSYLLKGVIALIIVMTFALVVLFLLRREKPKDVPKLLQMDKPAVPVTIPNTRTETKQQESLEVFEDKKIEKEDNKKEEKVVKGLAEKKKPKEIKRKEVEKKEEGGDVEWKVIK